MRLDRGPRPTASGDDDLRARCAALTLEQRVRLLTGADMFTLHAEPAIGLRRIVTSDGPVGPRGEQWDERRHAVCLPSPSALAATWDPERIERLGGLLAAECRRMGVDVLLAPTINLHRTPFGGRHFECLSEDPLLTGAIAAAYVRGLQAGGVAATVKHVVANDSETERFTYDAQVAPDVLEELYLAPFEHVVREAGPWAVMAAYNSVGGTTMTEHPMLDELLRERWGFDGVVMSDWYAARSTEPAARAGLDLVMPGPDGPWGEALVAAVREGRVPEGAVDAKVVNLLRLAARVGALEGCAAPAAPAAWPPEAVHAEARAAAAAATVLARNEGGLLPLDAGALRRVAVLGPNAATARVQGGGSATVHPPVAISPLDGLRAALPGAEVVHAPGPRTRARLRPAEAAEVRCDGEPRGSASIVVDAPEVELVAVVVPQVTGEHVAGAGGVGRLRLSVDGRELFDVTHELAPDADIGAGMFFPPQHGVPLHLEAGVAVELRLRAAVRERLELLLEPPPVADDDAIAEAVALAAGADLAVVVVGTNEEVESEGADRTTLALPGRQDELVRAVAAANPRTVVVVNAGAPVLLPWADEVPVVLLSWFGGQALGEALADVLLGAAEPAGRLPTTWPATEEGLPSVTPVDGVLAYDEGLAIGARSGVASRYPFGHGLGWTTWAYEAARAVGGDVEVDVRNTGRRPGREVVQLYAERRLLGFAAVHAGPGERVTARIALRGALPPGAVAGRCVDDPGVEVA